jgi:hypothetical protein
MIVFLLNFERRAKSAWRRPFCCRMERTRRPRSEVQVTSTGVFGLRLLTVDTGEAVD